MNDKNTDFSANVFSKMLRAQLLATLIVALIAFIISGIHAGFSALAGGLSVVLAAFIASKMAISKRTDAASVLGSMLKAELIKIILIILFLFITIKFYKYLVPLALIAGLATAAILSGATISKANDKFIK
jgi:ATP synthase protein I